jgi:hypothetical protein
MPHKFFGKVYSPKTCVCGKDEGDALHVADAESWTKSDQIARAQTALAAYKDGDEYGLTDLLADLRHWAEANDVNFEHCADISYSHYCEENGDAGDEPLDPEATTTSSPVDSEPIPLAGDETPASQRPSQCGGCGKVWKDYELDNISDEDTDSSNEPAPTGLCPQCGEACYELPPLATTP